MPSQASSRGRRPLRAGVIALAALAWAPTASAQQAAPSPTPAAGRASDGDCPDADDKGTCLVGVRRTTGSIAAYADYSGKTGSLGLGYLQTVWRRASYEPSQRTDWHAYGLTGRAFMADTNDGIRAWGAMATGRVGATRRVGVSLELSAGPVFGDGRTIGVGSAGVFGTIFYVDVGYSLQLPLGSSRPEWLGTHILSIRGHLPFVQFGQSDWRSSDGWFPGS